MKLTTKRLVKYIGGQMEIRKQGGRYLYRGEIKSIAVKNSNLKLKFAWLAKGERFPYFSKHWVNDDKLDYGASLEIYHVSEIRNGCLLLNSSIIDELVVFYPPDGSNKLDPSRVEGLQLSRV